MGAVAALLAGACVAPVVIQVVLFSSNLYATGTKVALALPFCLGLGMAIPWPIAGAGLAALPKPGMWMVRVKQAFGVFIMATAVYYGYEAYSIFANRWVDPAAVSSSVEGAAEGRLARVARRRPRPRAARAEAGADRHVGDLVQELPDDGQDDAGERGRAEGAVAATCKIKYQAEDPDQPPAKTRDAALQRRRPPHLRHPASHEVAEDGDHREVRGSLAPRRAQTRARTADRGRGPLRHGLARALFHRRQRLPDRAARRRRAADARGCRARRCEIAARHGVSITARGGGTSQAGQAIGAGLQLDSSKYFNRILEVNAAERWARVEPGVVLDELNAQLQAARPALRARHLDRQPRDRRRHDRQQLERRALGPLRQDHRPRPRAARRAGRRSGRALPAARRAGARDARAPATTLEAACYRTVRELAAAQPRRDRPPLPEGAAARRRLQPRRVRRSGRSRSTSRS